MLCILLLHLKTTFWDRIHGTKELKWSSIHWKQDETKVWWSDSRRWGWDKRLWAFSVHFSSVVSYSLWPHEPQHARPPCPSPTLGVYPNPCPLSWWCYLTISSSVVPFSSCPQSLPASGSFQIGQLFASGGQKYWRFSFNISPSNEHPGLISFRMDWLDLLAVQGTLKSLLQHHSSKASIFLHSAFFILQLTSIHDYWKNHSLD